MKKGSILSPSPSAIANFTDRFSGPIKFKPINHFLLPADGNEYGNDIFGDCDCVADFRLIQNWGGAITYDLVIGRYSQLTGFNPNIPSSDRGTDTNMDLQSWCNFPIFDGTKVWKILWSKIDPGDTDALLTALSRFPLLITIQLPPAVENHPDLWRGQPGPGKAWVPRDCHRVLLGAWNGSNYVVYTWGRYVEISAAMLDLMLVTVDVVIPHPDTMAPGKALHGLDLSALQCDLESLKPPQGASEASQTARKALDAKVAANPELFKLKASIASGAAIAKKKKSESGVV